MPLGADPHSFEPAPRDMAAVVDAHVVFANGAGLEEFLDSLMESAEAEEKTVHVSHGIAFRRFDGESEGDGEHDHAADDPHTWTDPNNVMVWAQNIEDALSNLDPTNGEAYRVNAEAYRAELQELDAWIREQVAQIPEKDRQIVTDHTILGYLADRYGFVQVGAIVPGYSSLAEPSAKELAELEDAIRQLGVEAVFVGSTVNPALAETVAQDTGVQLVTIYTGSLSEKGGQADTYIAYMRYNVEAIVQALR
jgi:ABC-type Zn uptake system ZnuABC Zn-binding protein ZnuA